jgi:hypothetical protein
MIIYVNIDKTTGNIIVNNDRYPDSDVVQLNQTTLVETESATTFEIAFNTTSFENKMFPNTSPLPILDNTNGNTN